MTNYELQIINYELRITNYELFFHFQSKHREVGGTDSHDEDGTERAHEIGHKAHAKREDGSSEQSHDHQTGDLVLVLGVMVERLRETDREDIGVTKSDECDTDRDRKSVV